MIGTDVRKDRSDGLNTSNALFNTLALRSREIDTAVLSRTHLGRNEKTGVSTIRRLIREKLSAAIVRLFRYTVVTAPIPRRNNRSKIAFLNL
jgi:hypothetical protein